MTDCEQMRLCTNTKVVKNGNTYINCKLGLWGISSEHEHAESRAMHYFIQYRDDGEYHKILGGKSPVELLSERVR